MLLLPLLVINTASTVTRKIARQGCEKAKEEKVGKNTTSRMFLGPIYTKKCKDFCAHELLPSGPVRTGLPVNLSADLTSGSPKNAKHLI